MESLCLAHDIGHPPFGHGGETALNYKMLQDGGFEGNAQTFRIVTQLEPYTEHHGMNLSRRTLLGLIKYPSLISKVKAASMPEPVKHQRQLRAKDWMPAKGIYDHDKALFDWVLAPLSESDQALIQEPRKSSVEPFEHNKTKSRHQLQSQPRAEGVLWCQPARAHTQQFPSQFLGKACSKD